MRFVAAIASDHPRAAARHFPSCSQEGSLENAQSPTSGGRDARAPRATHMQRHGRPLGLHLKTSQGIFIEIHSQTR